MDKLLAAIAELDAAKAARLRFQSVLHAEDVLRERALTLKVRVTDHALRVLQAGDYYTQPN